MITWAFSWVCCFADLFFFIWQLAIWNNQRVADTVHLDVWCDHDWKLTLKYLCPDRFLQFSRPPVACTYSGVVCVPRRLSIGRCMSYRPVNSIITWTGIGPLGKWPQEPIAACTQASSAYNSKPHGSVITFKRRSSPLGPDLITNRR